MNESILTEVKSKLSAGGFDGLYVPGECGCTLEDLAPCGGCDRDEGKTFINGCEPGYLFRDPRPGHGGGWMIRGIRSVPEISDWEKLDISL